MPKKKRLDKTDTGGYEMGKVKDTSKKLTRKEKPPEVQAEEEQMSEEEKKAYLSLRGNFCYACGKPLYNEPIFICSACNLSFCDEHRIEHDCIGYDRIKVLPLGIDYEDIYRICYFCGKKGQTYLCKECCGQFCNDHRYSDDHRCRVEPKKQAILDHGVIIYTPVRMERSECLEKEEQIKPIIEPPDLEPPVEPNKPPKEVVSHLDEKESKNGKVSKEVAVTILATILICLGTFAGFKLGFISSPYFENEKETSLESKWSVVMPTQTPTIISTPNLAEKLSATLGSYSYFGSHEFTGIKLVLIFENNNDVPVELTLVRGRIASGVEMLNSDRESKEPLDKFTIEPDGVISKEYYIPSVRLQEIEGDMLFVDMGVHSSEMNQPCSMSLVIGNSQPAVIEVRGD